MIFIQAEVDQIVARAREFGAGEGCIHKQGQFSLANYENRGAFDLALVLVGGWTHREDLIYAFRAAIEVLSGHPRAFSPDEYDAVVAHAEKLGLRTGGLPVNVPCSTRLISALLVTEFLADKYDLIYVLQALIEYCAYDHPASKRKVAPRSGLCLPGMAMAAAALFGGFGPCSNSLSGRPAHVPALPRDNEFYLKRARERRESKVRKKADHQFRTLEGKRKAATI